MHIAEPKRLTSFTYFPDNSLQTKTEQATNDANGSQGLNVAVVGLARTWSYTYNTLGQMLTATGPRADVLEKTTYRYDATTGNLGTITTALGHVTTLLDYDAHGRVGKIVDPNGVVTRLIYKPRGWLASQTVSDGVAESKDVCVIQPNWTPNPPQTGHAVQRKLDTHSTPNWTVRAQRRGVEVGFYS